MGENYVLGTRDDDNVYEPTRVHPKMFNELSVKLVGAGGQHVVVLTSASQDTNSKLPPMPTGNQAQPKQAESQPVEEKPASPLPEIAICSFDAPENGQKVTTPKRSRANSVASRRSNVSRGSRTSKVSRASRKRTI